MLGIPGHCELQPLTAAVVSIRGQHILGGVAFTSIRAIPVDADLTAATDVL